MEQNTQQDRAKLLEQQARELVAMQQNRFWKKRKRFPV